MKRIRNLTTDGGCVSGPSIGRIDRRHCIVTLGLAGDWRQANTRARGAISGEDDVEGVRCDELGARSRKGKE